MPQSMKKKVKEKEKGSNVTETENSI